MRVLYLITELQPGGAECALCEVACHLAQQGAKPHVVCLHSGSGPLAHRLQEAGIPLTDLEMTGPLRLGRCRRYRQLLRDVRPALVHSWLFHGNLLGRLATPPGLPVLNSLRVVEPRATHILLDRWTRGRAALSLCVSEQVRRFAIDTLRHPAERCRVIENGVDAVRFQNPAPPGAPAQTLHGLTIGRKVPQKGLDILIEGLALVSRELPWQWSFVGAAPEPAYCDQLRRRLDVLSIAERVTLSPARSQADLPAVYHEANLFALPSRYEGQANVILEAFAAGLPVLASSAHGHSIDAPLVEVSPNTPRAWAAALTKAWAERRTWTTAGEAGLAYAKERSWNRVALRHLEIYEECLCAC